MANKNLRNEIVEAVNRVVARNGLNGTTIDAVAAEAGVSKGGVLYYFSSKKDLLIGMLSRYETDFFEKRDEILAAMPETPHRMLKATVMAMLADLEATSGGNFATVLDDDELRKRVGLFKQGVFKDCAAELSDPADVALVMYIVDGLWMDARFKPMVVSKSVRKRAVKKLLAFIDAIEGKR